jgi:hypothetical protein
MHLLPITQFKKEELDEAVVGMKNALMMPPPRYALVQPSLAVPDIPISQPPQCNPYDIREASRIHHDQVKVTPDEFQVPVVVMHVQLQGRWDLQYLVEEHGAAKVTLRLNR